MQGKSSPEKSLDDEISAPSPAAAEALDFALVSSSLLTIVATFACVAWLNFNSIPDICTIIVLDLLVVFLVVPHLVAQWLDCDIDALLQRDI